MKYITLAACLLASVAHADYCQTIGSHTFCSNGYSEQRIGDMTFGSDGSYRQRIGGTEFFTPPPPRLNISPYGQPPSNPYGGHRRDRRY